MQLWADGTIWYRKWTPLGDIPLFLLFQVTRLTAELSRDCGQDLFTTTPDKVFDSADRIRFVSLGPPRMAQVGKGSALVCEVRQCIWAGMCCLNGFIA